MSTQDIQGMREQILANARFLLRSPASYNPGSVNTLLAGFDDSMHVIVSGEGTQMRAIVLLGMEPAIQGPEAASPEAALRKLLTAVIETTSQYLPGMAGHMRNIHRGGIFDEDLVSPELFALKEAQQKKSG